MKIQSKKFESWLAIGIIIVMFLIINSHSNSNKSAQIIGNSPSVSPIDEQNYEKTNNPTNQINSYYPRQDSQSLTPTPTSEPTPTPTDEPTPSLTPTRIPQYGDASLYNRVGNTLYGSDGTTYTQIGNTTSGSTGTNYNSAGSTTYGSDGTSYQHIGNTTFGSNGTTCHTYGSMTQCSGGN